MGEQQNAKRFQSMGGNLAETVFMTCLGETNSQTMFMQLVEEEEAKRCSVNGKEEANVCLLNGLTKRPHVVHQMGRTKRGHTCRSLNV